MKWLLGAIVIIILSSATICFGSSVRVLYDSPYSQKELYKIADFITFNVLEVKVASPEGYWVKIQIKHNCGIVDFAWDGVPEYCWIYIKAGE